MNSELLVVRVLNPRIGEGVVAALKLSRSDTNAGEARAHLEPGSFGADVEDGEQIVALAHLDNRPTRPGNSLAPFGDDPHDRLGVQAGRRNRLLHLEHRLEEL